jgi:phage FluMu protein Com
MATQPNSKSDNRQPAQAPDARDVAVRCHCGSLIARVVAGGLELKCRRCKRQIIVPFDIKRSMRVTL